MTDALSKLPRFSWRGQELPLIHRSVRFSHEDTDHTFQYRDGELVERKGVKNWTFSYSIPFRQDIAKGPYQNLFTVQLLDFIFACRDKSPDTLRDPVIGSMRAVCSTYEEETDVQRRDGTDVRVEFKASPLQDDVALETIQGGLSGLTGVSNQSGALDKDIGNISWPIQTPSPEPSTDPLSAISGFGRQIINQGNKMSAALDNVAYKAEQIETTAALLEDPHTFQIARSSRRVQTAALKFKDRIQSPDRRILRVTLAYGKSLSRIAADAGMTVQDLLKLNPTIAGRPVVPAGATVGIFAR